jgi:hypothetical protein
MRRDEVEVGVEYAVAGSVYGTPARILILEPMTIEKMRGYKGRVLEGSYRTASRNHSYIGEPGTRTGGWGNDRSDPAPTEGFVRPRDCIRTWETHLRIATNRVEARAATDREAEEECVERQALIDRISAVLGAPVELGALSSRISGNRPGTPIEIARETLTALVEKAER